LFKKKLNKMASKKQLETPLFERFASSQDIALYQTDKQYIKDIRSAAFESFQQNGFPSTKNEEWRFTNMAPFLKDDYILSGLESMLSLAEIDAIHNAVTSQLELIKEKGIENPYKLILINGYFSEELSILPEASMVKIGSLNDNLDHPTVEKYFGTITKTTDAAHSYAALNTALYANGLFIEVPKGKVVDQPIYIFNVYTANRPTMILPRNLVVVSESAEVAIVESIIDHTFGHNVLINKVTEVAVAANAHCHHYDVQEGSNSLRIVQRTEATQMKDSTYNNYTFTFPGAAIVRNNLAIHLNEAQLESHLYGLYLTGGTQLVDNHTEVHHKFPNGESNQLYKGVLLDQSRGVFNGKIKVYEDAQKTNAFQQSNNMLYSNEATVNAKPQLEIYADDVKCSHGTTIGQLSDESLFYLQSRGIGIASARKLMVNAFAFDVTQKIKLEQLKYYLEDKIQETIK
jgi:Fe-S cluster assembly protein SufD